jgi:hypothetical protein
MKSPPFLLFGALLFWGWQSEFFFTGAILGVILESARFINARWDLDDADFNRIWTFCVVLNVALAGYGLTNNDGGAGALATTRFLRWLPLTTFAFIAAQTFNVRQTVPLTAVSLVLRWRRRKGDRAFTGRYLDISFPFFMACLFSAGIHSNAGGQTFFWGECALLTWALWSLRSRRFGRSAWFAAILLVLALGFLGEFSITQAQRAIQNFDSQWLMQFFPQRTDPLQSMTSMGRIGKMKLSAKIIIWLEPKKIGVAPLYLHEASYRDYSSRKQIWFAGHTQNDFDFVGAEADKTTWDLLPGKTNAASVNITCYLTGRSKEGFHEGVLPLPSGCSRLENLPAEVSVISLQKNRTGAVLATGSGLMIFDARFGPGESLDSPPDINSTNPFDLTVPPDETNALQNVIAEINLAHTDDAQKRERIEKFFRDKFAYSVWQGADKLGTATATPLTRFLLTSRSGHCEYFATATVLLLRQLGIPARYAAGYAVHETSGTGFIVRERDAHAWCLAWNARTKTWEDFDTTPPSWVAIESERTAFWEKFSDAKSWLGLQFEKFRYRQAHLQQYILWALVPVMVVLLYHIVFRRRKKTIGAEKEKPAEKIFWPGLDSEFYRLETKLAARGVPRQPSEPLADWLACALADPALADWRTPLQELLQLHYRLRFDPSGLTAAERAALAQQAKDYLSTLNRLEQSAARTT